jgi:hypothetical protein
VQRNTKLARHSESKCAFTVNGRVVSACMSVMAADDVMA